MQDGASKNRAGTKRHVIAAALVVAGIIHLVPLSGVFGAERLTALYGLPISDPSLLVLMRHRAVLFGLLGVFLIFAAFRPPLHSLAFLAGFVSVLSFFWIAWSTGGYNEAVARIITGDIVALVALVIGAAARTWRQP